MNLKDKIKDQYVNYREILKESNVVDEIKQSIPGKKELKGLTNGSKENTRKWHSKIY